MAADSIARLVRMANQIALNTGAHSDPEGSARRTAEHIQKFWTPVMRAQLTEFVQQDGAGLEPAVIRALQ